LISDGREDSCGTEMSGDPGECHGPPCGASWWYGSAALFELLFPEYGMSIFGVRESEIEIGNLFSILGSGHGAIEVCGIDLGLTESAIALNVGRRDGCWR
jgi:hypothetical protein